MGELFGLVIDNKFKFIMIWEIITLSNSNEMRWTVYERVEQPS